jgi:hypothetical protein
MVEHTYSNVQDYKELVAKICFMYYHHILMEDDLWYIVKLRSDGTWKKYSDIYRQDREQFIFTDELAAWAYCTYLALNNLF